MARRDLDRIDGFDAAYTGWGLEDSDLVVRLLHAGVRRKDGRFATGVLHLWHPQNDRSQFAGQPGAARRGHRRRPRACLARSVRARATSTRRAGNALDGATMKPISLARGAARPHRGVAPAGRRIVDATPLIRSVKRAFPESAIDVLVFAGTEGILTGNPDFAQSLPSRNVRASVQRWR